jgi:hypothetical protein
MAKIAVMISHSGVVFGELKSKDLITGMQVPLTIGTPVGSPESGSYFEM